MMRIAAKKLYDELLAKQRKWRLWEPIDEVALQTYCEWSAHLDRLERPGNLSPEDKRLVQKQRWHVARLAGKLGLTARARRRIERKFAQNHRTLRLVAPEEA